MGRHAGGAAPPEPWPRRLRAAALRWAARVLLGAVAGGVVLLVLGWTGVTGTAARALAVGAAVLVVVAAALAATVPPPAGGQPSAAPGAPGPGPRSHDR